MHSNYQNQSTLVEATAFQSRLVFLGRSEECRFNVTIFNVKQLENGAR